MNENDMNSQNDEYFVQGEISTPDDNIIDDIERLILPNIDKAEIKKRIDEKGIYEKLILLAERLEFIESLKFLMKMIKNNHTYTLTSDKRCHYHCNWLGHDFAGCHKDIESLIIYLLLSCLDTIMGQLNHQDPFEWLLKEIITTSRVIDSVELEKFKNDYKKEYGLTNRFKLAFTDFLDPDLTTKWVNSFMCVEIDEPKDGPLASTNKEIETLWKSKNEGKKIKAIAHTLYDMRSSFTHGSIRSFLFDTPLQKITSKPITSNKNKTLIAIGKVDFIDLLEKTIKALAMSQIWDKNKPK